MYYYVIGNVHVWTTDTAKKDAVWDTKLLMRGLFSRRKLFPRVMRAHALSEGLSLKPNLLIAHGKVRRGRWLYVDSRRRLATIQSWVDQHDGTAGTLLLFCCNKLNLEIHSRSSLVVHLNRAASRWDLFRGGCLRLYHPRFGYIEDNYYRLRSVVGS